MESSYWRSPGPQLNRYLQLAKLQCHRDLCEDNLVNPKGEPLHNRVRVQTHSESVMMKLQLLSPGAHKAQQRVQAGDPADVPIKTCVTLSNGVLKEKKTQREKWARECSQLDHALLSLPRNSKGN